MNTPTRVALPFSLFAALLAGCQVAPAAATPPLVTPGTMTVVGTARLEVVPDEACVEVTFASTKPRAETAHDALRAGLDQFLASVGELHAPRLVVEEGLVAYAPEFRVDELGNRRRSGYTARAEIHVRTKDFARVPDVIRLAVGDTLEEVRVRHYATTLPQLKTRIREMAIEAARSKARALVDGFDAELAGVQSIAEDAADARHFGAGGETNVYNVVQNFAQVPDGVSDAPARPGAVPLTMTITVTYRLG